MVASVMYLRWFVFVSYLYHICIVFSVRPGLIPGSAMVASVSYLYCICIVLVCICIIFVLYLQEARFDTGA